MLARNRIYLICSALLLAVAIILIWNIIERESEFETQQKAMREAILSGASGEITAFIRNYQQRVHIFSSEYTHLLEQLSTYPDDQLIQILETRLDQRFPDYENYALTKRSGESLIDRFEQEIGSVCRSDLSRFSHELDSDVGGQFNDVYIHPHPLHYHFDVMSGWKGRHQEGIFLVSYPASILASVLASHQIPGHQLVLVSNDNQYLVEITSKGSRDSIDRERNLTEQELRLWSTAVPINGSRWKLIDLIDPQIYKQNSQALRTQAGAIILILFIASLLILLIGRKEKPNRG